MKEHQPIAGGAGLGWALLRTGWVGGGLREHNRDCGPLRELGLWPACGDYFLWWCPFPFVLYLPLPSVFSPLVLVS